MRKRERDPDADRDRRMVRKQVHGVMARISDWQDAGAKLFGELAEKTFFTKKKTKRGTRGGKAMQERRRNQNGEFVAYVDEGVMVDVSTSPRTEFKTRKTEKNDRDSCLK